MAQKHKVRTSTQRETYRLTAQERRAARLAGIAGQQQDLKREAAERRAKRAQRDDAASADAPVSVGPEKDVGQGHRR